MPLPPQSIIQDRYRIEALLGQGGMGAVYEGWDLRLRIPCAIKENTASRQFDNPALAAALADQFEREATILAALNHPNLPRVTNYFLAGADQYLVMDYIAGENLAARLARRGPLPEAEVLAVADQICAALTYLHSRPAAPVIHRDIKPANIKAAPDGRLMLVDFGLSKEDEPGKSTIAGARGWTRGYSPLEQYIGGTGPRSDQYALAATLYTLLTDRVPVDALERKQGAALARLGAIAPAVSARTEAVLLRALSLAAEDRYETIEAFAAGLLTEDPPAAAEPAPGAEPTAVGSRASLLSASGRAYAVSRARNIIGRRNRKTGEVPEIDLSEEADGDTVSRKHAWLNWQDGAWRLAPHAGHKNIVKVNGRPLPESGQSLKPDDEIQIGAVRLRFQTK